MWVLGKFAPHDSVLALADYAAGAAVTLAQIVGRAFVTGASCATLCACYPAFKAVQPDVTLRVTDTSGAPIAGAAFTLATFEQPFTRSNDVVRATYRTDEDGYLSLPKKRKWVWQVVLPDAFSPSIRSLTDLPSPASGLEEIGKIVVIAVERERVVKVEDAVAIAVGVR